MEPKASRWDWELIARGPRGQNLRGPPKACPSAPRLPALSPAIGLCCSLEPCRHIANPSIAALPADDEFDIDKEKAGSDAELQPEDAPPEWDIDAPLQPAPFNVMLTCYTLFERDRCEGSRRQASMSAKHVRTSPSHWPWSPGACQQDELLAALFAPSRPHPHALYCCTRCRRPTDALPALHPTCPPPNDAAACSPEQRLDRGFLEKWRWSHLIMDEAHALKNRNASRTTRLRRVSNASRRRIMMTGGHQGLVGMRRPLGGARSRRGIAPLCWLRFLREVIGCRCLVAHLLGQAARPHPPPCRHAAAERPGGAAEPAALPAALGVCGTGLRRPGRHAAGACSSHAAPPPPLHRPAIATLPAVRHARLTPPPPPFLPGHGRATMTRLPS